MILPVAAACAFALGTWAAFGTVALLGPDTSPRLILPASPWILAVAALAAFSFVMGRRPTAGEAAPLWLPAIALVPWLPLPLPAAALLWTGPLARALVVVAISGAIAPLLWRRGFSPAGPRVAFVLAAVLYSGAAWRLSPILPSGDEPHYLVIADSLLHDRDLKIENNHAAPGYVTNLIGDLKPDYLRRGRDGQIYSIHAPGLPALVLPAYALAGYPGVVLFLALLSAVGAVLAWRAAFALTNDAGAAWIGWASVALSAPFFFQAFTIFPDAAAAVIVMFLVYALVGEEWLTSPGRLAVVGAALAFLPWLHTRYALIAVSAGAVVLLRLLWRRGFRLRVKLRRTAVASAEAVSPAGRFATDGAAFMAVPLVSAIAWLLMFHQIYGTFDPRAPYGGVPEMRVARIPVGLTGLLIDQQFGLLPNAPIYLVAIGALVAFARQNRRLCLELLAIAAPYVIAVAAFHMWWAGVSSPARFLVPVLLPLAVPVAGYWKRHPSGTPRVVALMLLSLSVGITAVMACAGEGSLLYNTRDGFARWLDWIAPAVNLDYTLPSLFQGGVASAWGRAATWTIVLAAAWFGLRTVERRLGRVSTAIAAAMLIATVSVGATAAWIATGRTAIGQGSSAVALLNDICGRDRRLVRIAPLAISTIRLAGAGLSVSDDGRRPLAAGTPIWTGRSLPPGRYRVHLDSGLNTTGSLNVAFGRTDVFIQQCTFADRPPGPTDCLIDLPAGAASLWLTPDTSMRSSIEALRLEPREAKGACGLRATYAAVSPAGTIFTETKGVYAERAGVWVAGGAAAQLTVLPRGDRVLVVRNGPVANLVRVNNGPSQEQHRLAPGELITIRLYKRPGETAVPLTVWSESGFRPAEVQVGTRDFRWLGVWVTLQ